MEIHDLDYEKASKSNSLSTYVTGTFHYLGDILKSLMMQGDKTSIKIHEEWENEIWELFKNNKADYHSVIERMRKIREEAKRDFLKGFPKPVNWELWVSEKQDGYKQAFEDIVRSIKEGQDA